MRTHRGLRIIWIAAVVVGTGCGPTPDVASPKSGTAGRGLARSRRRRRPRRPRQGSDDALRLGERPGARRARLPRGHRLRSQIARLRQGASDGAAPAARQHRQRAASLPHVRRPDDPRLRRTAERAQGPERHLLLRHLQRAIPKVPALRRRRPTRASPTTFWRCPAADSSSPTWGRRRAERAGASWSSTRT